MKIKESWNAAYQGSGNSHRVAVLEEGMKYQPIGLAPEHAQFMETRKFQINEIARIFRVPPHMLAELEKSSFSNIEQQSLEFVKYSRSLGGPLGTVHVPSSSYGKLEAKCVYQIQCVKPKLPKENTGTPVESLDKRLSLIYGL